MLHAGRRTNRTAERVIVAAIVACLGGCAGPWTASSHQRRESFFRGEQELEAPRAGSGANGQGTFRPRVPNGTPASPNTQTEPPTPKGPSIPRSTTQSPSKLELKVQADKQRQVGSPATFRLELKNVGTEAVNDLAVDCDFEKPLVFPGHPDAIARRKVGTLLPGETSKMALSLVSEKPGNYCCEFTVHAAGRELLWKAVCVNYVARRTSLRLFAPPKRTVGGRAETTLMFANVGKTELRDVTVSATFDGTVLKPFEFSHGARLGQRQAESTLTWTWKSLKPGQGVPLQMEFDCLREVASACVRVTVSSPTAPEIDASACVTIVRPRPDWDIRVADTLDPAKVGDETALVVSIGNRGRIAAQPGKMGIDIPANFRVVSTSVWQGARQLPVQATTRDARVTFDRPRQLAPNTDISYRVRVKALRPGNAAFKATLFDAAEKPLLEREEPVTVVGG